MPVPGLLPYNFILDTDSYKESHHDFYPPDLEYVHSYGESRGTRDARYKGTFTFGLQAWILERLMQPVTRYQLQEAVDFCAPHGVPFAKGDWWTILDEFGGFMPLEIKGIDEGTHIPLKHPLVTVENTDPRFAWLTSYVETQLLRHVWYATSVATRVAYMKSGIKKLYDECAGGDYSQLPFALLDFSGRGSAGYDAGMIGGAAYLTCFQGSDTMSAIRYANHFYSSAMSGFSVRATEHSVMCAWGEDGPEVIRALLNRCPPGTIISIVADTWNVFECAKTIAGMAREFQEKRVIAVVRPDSGEMNDVLPDVIKIVADGFDAARNSDGYHVINGAKVLQGDGIDDDSYLTPFLIAKDLKIAPQSIMAASGGGLMMRDMDRDLFKFAFKASAIRRRGESEWTGIAKDPITDPGKKSKMGRHLVFMSDQREWSTLSGIDNQSYAAPNNKLKLRYRNGETFNLTTIDEIRARVDAELAH